VRAEKMFHVAVMPCFDKKLEGSRPDFADPDTGARDVDCVLTTTELLELLGGTEGVARALATATFGGAAQPPFATVDSLLHRIVGASSSAASASASGLALPGMSLAEIENELSMPHDVGASGGYAENIFRFAARELHAHDIALDQPLVYRTTRNADLRELSLSVGGRVVMRFALAYGFRNIQNIVRKLKRGQCEYQYVEIMACPSGCLNGGGQLRAPSLDTAAASAATSASSADDPRAHVARLDALYHTRKQRAAGESTLARMLYASVLGGRPGSPEARRLLHTEFHAVAPLEERNPLGIRW
jgi:iron only hydrogenase large subunit-like protein